MEQKNTSDTISILTTLLSAPPTSLSENGPDCSSDHYCPIQISYGSESHDGKWDFIFKKSVKENVYDCIHFAAP